MASIISGSERLIRLTSFSMASRILIICSRLLLSGRERFAETFVAPQSRGSFFRFFAGTKAANAHPVPDLSFDVRLRDKRVVSLIFQTINQICGGLGVGVGVGLHAPAHIVRFRFAAL